VYNETTWFRTKKNNGNRMLDPGNSENGIRGSRIST
jgi:hypothetical protein